MKTYGLSDNLSQMKQGKVSKSSMCFSVGWGFSNEGTLFLHPDTLQLAKTETGPFFEVQIMWIDAY